MRLEKEIINGRRLSYDEAVELARTATDEELSALADTLRRHFHGGEVDLCSIMNARSGRCPQDCKWCAQSAHHATAVEIYSLVGAREAVQMARHNADKGVRRFSLVTSGRTMTDDEVQAACEIYREIERDVPSLSLCASMGLLGETQLRALRDAGVGRYHCNLETAPSFFPSLCTTHTVADKMETLRCAQRAGMDVCSGGIIGMGETEEHRIELAVALRELNVASIPLNVLVPIPGTPLETAAPLSDSEISRCVALLCIIAPDARIRLAGGRAMIDRTLERRLLCGGASALITGEMLTTSGPDIDSDIAMIQGYRKSHEEQ
ncbi:MAG: biotin synthase BioB [Rikenellaceae bacterium]|nr:biotin synthase BioB [Rikenellaceae bacterium]MCL2693037.1 biotin synthase BioB [Rikenellaceae bacterium]